MCLFGIRVFQTPGNTWGEATSHPTLTATRLGYQNDHGIGGTATHCSQIREQLHFTNICKKLWYPWIHAAPDGSWVIIFIKRTSRTTLFSPEVIERCEFGFEDGGEGV